MFYWKMQVMSSSFSGVETRVKSKKSEVSYSDKNFHFFALTRKSYVIASH